MSDLEKRTQGGAPVTVVGPDPAGLACAIALARREQRVVIRERRPHVGGMLFHCARRIE